MLARRSVLPALLLVAWQIVAVNGNPLLFATPAEVADDLWTELTTDDQLYEAIGVSMQRGFTGLAIAAAVAFPLGFAMAQSRVIRAMFEPIITGTYPIVRIALYSVLILTFGVSGGEIALVAMECFYPLVYNTYGGARTIDRNLIWAARSAGMGRLRIARSVFAPAALPSILAGLRIAVPVMLIVVTIVEMIAGSQGLGYLMQNAAAQLEPTGAMSVIVVLALLGVIFDRTISFLSRHIVFWERGVEL